jgi:5-methylcytosine-specific restriction enzyme subunit McrC
MSSKIPIRNLYYLLCYAWDRLEAKGLAEVFTDGQRDVTNLIARIVVGAASYVVRRGMDRSYVTRSDVFPYVRGRVDTAATIAVTGGVGVRVFCHYDELDPDVLHNQVMKATLRWLLRTNDVAPSNRLEASAALSKLSEVSDIELTPNIFGRIRLHRNNAYYALLMNACELLLSSALPTPDGIGYTLQEFAGAPKEMAHLFEKFIANFYAREQDVFAVERKRMSWGELTGAPAAVRTLPAMITDVVLLSPSHAIVIDCKFYEKALRGDVGREHVRPEHLYQISSYARSLRLSLPGSSRLDAILLYPTVKRARPLDFSAEQYDVKVRFINLNQDWRLIHRDLLRIVGLYEKELTESLGDNVRPGGPELHG